MPSGNKTCITMLCTQVIHWYNVFVMLPKFLGFLCQFCLLLEFKFWEAKVDTMSNFPCHQAKCYNKLQVKYIMNTFYECAFNSLRKWSTIVGSNMLYPLKSLVLEVNSCIYETFKMPGLIL